MENSAIISSLYDRPGEITRDFIEASRVTWKQARSESARLILEARARARNLSTKGYSAGYTRGLVEGHSAAGSLLKAKLDELTRHDAELEAAVISRVIYHVKESLEALVGSCDHSHLSLSDYVAHCLSSIPKSGRPVVRVHPRNASDLAQSGIECTVDSSVSPEYIEVDVAAGTLRFSWFADLIADMENRCGVSLPERGS